MSEWVAFSEIIRNAALTLAALVGAALAWRQLSPAALQARSANMQANLARRAHVTELFNRAVGQLRDPNLEVRLAAIYVLREVAKDFPDLSNPVFELLQAHLRANKVDYGDEDPPIDIKEIIATLRNRLGAPDAES
ncbi:hypothetical protein [Bradyrhizobium sp.]|uniref:hypothetical protein n=1 Tax=Bradyrhizobium sp. TaxID=376 RepID=UPI002CD039F0|nr:hypothetical protein [Bradyrhizobium sp.]HMM90484.1 hypothetical protein [Bradyrhizobium sp.]